MHNHEPMQVENEAVSRTDQVRALLAQHDAEAALVTFLPDVRWACGFTGSNGLLLVLKEGAHFVTDGRYKTQAEEQVTGADVHVPGYDLFGHIAEVGLFGAAKRVVFQADHVTAAQLEHLEEAFPEITWHGAEKLLAERVARKTGDEVERIRQAQRVTESVFEYLLGFIQPGMREQEVAAEIVCQHLRRGAS
ncbi:MAG: aminopeptidase P family protein, partial [Rhodothermales bacterium]